MARYDRSVTLTDQSGDFINSGNPLPTTGGGGGGSGGTSMTDKSTFTEGTTQFTPVGGVRLDTPVSDVADGKSAAVRITPKRAMWATLRNEAGTEIGTSSDPIRTNPTGTTAQPVTDGGGSLTVDDGGGSITVDGVVAATQSGTWSVQLTDGSLTASIRNTGSNDSLNVAIVDASGNHITSFGGGTQYTEADVDATPMGTVSMWWDDGDNSIHAASPTNPFPVIVVSGGGGGMVDDSPFSPGVDTVVPMGALFDDVATDTVDEGDIGAPRMSGNRILYVSTFAGSPVAVTDNGGSLTVDDGGGSLTVDGTVAVSSVSGNVTVVQSTATNLKVDASGVPVPVTDNGGSLTVDGMVSVSGSVAVTQSTSPWVVGDGGGTLSIDDGGGSITVDGTVAITGSTVLDDLTDTGTLLNNGDFVIFDTRGCGGGMLQLISSGAAIFTLEGSVNGTDWVEIYSLESQAIEPVLGGIFSGAAPALYLIGMPGLKQIKITQTLTFGGTTTADFRASAGSYPVRQVSPMPALTPPRSVSTTGTIAAPSGVVTLTVTEARPNGLFVLSGTWVGTVSVSINGVTTPFFQIGTSNGIGALTFTNSNGTYRVNCGTGSITVNATLSSGTVNVGISAYADCAFNYSYILAGDGRDDLGKSANDVYVAGSRGLMPVAVLQTTRAAISTGGSGRFTPLQTNDFGELRVDASGTTLTTTFSPGSGATDLGKAEDAAHATGDVGVMMLAVRNDTMEQLSSKDGAYTPLQLDAFARLPVFDRSVKSELDNITEVLLEIRDLLLR